MKHFKKSHSKDQLLPGYENFLCNGHYIDADEQFDDEPHARRVWLKHKDKIMRTYEPGGEEFNHQSPGKRPWAYFKYDLKIDPDGGYYEQTRKLIKLNLLANIELEMIRKDPLIAGLIAKDNVKLQRLFGIEKAVKLAKERQEKSKREYEKLRRGVNDGNNETTIYSLADKRAGGTGIRHT